MEDRVGVVEDRGVDEEWGRESYDLLRIQRDLAVALSAMPPPAIGFRISLEAALEASSMDGGGIYVFEESTGDLVLMYATGLSEAFIGQVSRYSSAIPNYHLVKAGRPVYSSYSGLLPSTDPIKASEGLRALAVVPIIREGRVLGCINVTSHTAEEVPGPRRYALESIARQLGGAIHYIQVAEALKMSQEKLRAHASDLAFLEQTATLLLEKLTDQQLYEFIANKLFQLTEDALVAVSELDQEKRIRVRAVRTPGRLPDEIAGALSHAVESYSVKYNEKIEDRLLRSGLFTLEGSLYEIINQELPEDLPRDIERLLKIEAAYAVGFVRKNKLFGSAVIVTQQGSSTVNFPLVEAFVAQAAVALERNLAEAEKAQMEEQLLHSQKLEALGTLAGGIAHDFNNLLTVILTTSEAALLALEPMSPLRNELKEIYEAAGRAEALARRLLNFSRRDTAHPQVLDLNSVVRGLEPILKRLIGEDIKMRFENASEAAFVKTDPGQIEQVIVNLVTNACDAMARGGILTIRIDSVAHCRAEYASDDQQPPRYVLLSVIDTGSGMDEQTCKRAIEPFFTTKGSGKGTGLGLSTVYGIVEQSGGHLLIESAPDKGTKVKIYLLQEKPPTPEVEERTDDALPRGTETVLVIEDDASVRRNVVRMLKMFGYTVIESSEGVEALRLVNAYQGEIALVVTDVVMPGMSGPEVVRKLSEGRTIKVLYISGYPDRAIASRGIFTPLNFLQKPFRHEAFIKKVRQVLDS